MILFLPIMDSDLKNVILVKLYNRYFENFVLGFRSSTFENEFSDYKPNDVRIVLNELTDNFLISLITGSYKITVFGIKYVEDEELVDSTTYKIQRNEIIKILKNSYKENTEQYVSHELIIKELKLSGPLEILSHMKYLNDEGYLNVQMYLGGSFDAKLTNAGYQLSRGI